MKKVLIVLLLAGLTSFAVFAHEPERQECMKYVDAAAFPLYGKAATSTKTLYERLPASYEHVSREPVWFLGRNSAGLYVRFRTNSTAVKVRWRSMFCVEMPHMTSIGIRGLDLYTLYDGDWRFVQSARPSEDSTTDALVISGMEPEMREYLLYLSLYDGVDSLAIGVDRDAYIGQPEVARPVRERPVVMYGTSILQGCSASRPGMAHTNIIGRRLDREVINLGFSGSALLDYEIAGLMASVENPGVFVLDYVPNASVEQIREKGETFFRILRDAHPDVPAVFIEDPIFAHLPFNKDIREEVAAKNREQKALFDKLEKAGEQNIYYVSSENMIGSDGDATVDGIHFTDLGMMRYADLIVPVLEKALAGVPESEKLCQTPPMGWNSWNCFGRNIDEGQIREIADLMVSTGLRDAGYEFLTIDDCWQTHREDCVIQADSVKFASGIKSLADYVHGKGLKFGIYSCAGSKTCAGRPGSRGYEYIDAATYAGWGVDFLKYDWCHNNGADAKEAYSTMRDALDNTGRPIVLSICEWGTNKPWEWGKGVGELWRVSEDIICQAEGTSYWGGASIFRIIDIMAPLWPYAGPGHWNDADMLQVGNGTLTYDENVMHFSMWCMLSSPLMIGYDLRNADPKILDIFKNEEAISINQDRLGRQARMFERYSENHELWVKELADGCVALCFLNRDEKIWELDYHFWGFDMIGIGRTFDNYIVRDVWKHKDIGDTGDRYRFRIPAHGVVMLKLTPKS